MPNDSRIQTRAISNALKWVCQTASYSELKRASLNVLQYSSVGVNPDDTKLECSSSRDVVVARIHIVRIYENIKS